MMQFQRDYYNETLAGNETTRRLFINGIVSGAVEKFKTRIDQDQNKAPDSDILKFFFYSDHDDSTITMATAFKHPLDTYPPFASQIIFELWKNVTTANYYVKMRIND